jgi:hypothetical protein
MATSKIQVTEGSGKNIATNSFTEDAVTKEIQRHTINESDGTDTALAAKLGSLTETAPASDTASSGLNGRLQRIAQRITSLIGSTLIVGGDVASGSSDSGNPVKIGGVAKSSEQTAVTTGQRVNAFFDLTGKQIVMPYANPENFVNGTTAAITDTTSTSVIATAGASTRNYITSLTVTNSHATVGTFVKILDGASIIWEGYAAPSGGGFALSFPTPLRGSANTAVNAQAVTTGANFIVSAAGYKGV